MHQILAVDFCFMWTLGWSGTWLTGDVGTLAVFKFIEDTPHSAFPRKRSFNCVKFEATYSICYSILDRFIAIVRLTLFQKGVTYRWLFYILLELKYFKFNYDIPNHVSDSLFILLFNYLNPCEVSIYIYVLLKKIRFLSLRIWRSL